MPTMANISIGSATEQTASAFALWAEVYDHQPNPFLSLEERYVAQLLREVADRNVLDVGCGTGRWLKLLAARSPKQLIGVDSSLEMVSRAKAKLGHSATIQLGDCFALPIAGSSIDIVLASFTLSYLESLEGFVRELRRVIRPGGQIYISDLHPETVSLCGWKRGFRSRSGSVELCTHHRTLQEILDDFRVSGFRLRCILEPSFGPAEKETLRKAGKLQALESATGLPAIYVLQLESPDSDIQTSHVAGDDLPLFLMNAVVALGPRARTKANLSLSGGQIEFLDSGANVAADGGRNAETQLTLAGYLLLPGLINSHDHLEFGLFPRLGRGDYQNSQEWAADIQNTDAELVAKMRRIPKPVRIWWGAIRNLLCGVTTVCHHNPLTPELLDQDFPVRVLPAFGWAHSLGFEPDVAGRFHAASTEEPFILHAAEGVDTASANEIFELDRLRVLTDHTVLVHGLAVNEEGAALLNRRGTSVVWCPTSNRFLFGQTHSRELLKSIDNVVLGSDSSLTCEGDLLNDIRFAHTQVGVDEDELYRMVFSRPACVFRMHGGQGTLRPGAFADLIAIRDVGEDPATSVSELSSDDIGLVIVRGRVQLVSDSLIGFLPSACTTSLHPLLVDGRVIWIRAPLDWLLLETAKVVGSEITLGTKRVSDVCAA